jgi:putative ABC transport system permease protein
MVLLVGAGLMIRSFVALHAVDPGFDPHRVMTAHISMLGTANADAGRRGPFVDDVLRRVRAIPGVEIAGAINHLPIVGDNWGLGFAIEGRPAPRPGESPRATYRVVTPGYFEAMRIPIVRGRSVAETDREGSPRVVVINSVLASRYWPGLDPVGKRLTFDDPRDPNAEWITVIGVVPNVVTSDWSGPREPEVYLAYFQAADYLHRPGGHYASISIVARGEIAALAAPLRAAVSAVDARVVLSQLQPMEQVVAGATAPSRFPLLLLGAFAVVALALAAVGVYGVMSYTVSRRTHEIGIRVALGATPREALRLVISEGMMVALAGAVAGLVGALLLTRFMSTMLYGVGVLDPLTFALVAVVLCGVALVATYVPARRAAHIDPLVALRSD